MVSSRSHFVVSWIVLVYLGSVFQFKRDVAGSVSYPACLQNLVVLAILTFKIQCVVVGHPYGMVPLERDNPTVTGTPRAGPLDGMSSCYSWLPPSENMRFTCKIKSIFGYSSLVELLRIGFPPPQPWRPKNAIDRNRNSIATTGAPHCPKHSADS